MDFTKNSGPYHHILFSTSWVAVVLRDAMSAGFCLVGTYFLNSEGESFLISCNRFSTNCLYSLFEFRIQLSTTVESDQKVVESIFLTSSIASFTLSVNRDARSLIIIPNSGWSVSTLE